MAFSAIWLHPCLAGLSASCWTASISKEAKLIWLNDSHQSMLPPWAGEQYSTGLSHPNAAIANYSIAQEEFWRRNVIINGRNYYPPVQKAELPPPLCHSAPPLFSSRTVKTTACQSNQKTIRCWIPNIFVSPDWLGIVHKQHIFFKIFQGMHLNYVVML